MRIVIDLQSAQGGSRYRGIGRYSISLALALVKNRREHEVFIVLNGMYPDTIESIRAEFEGILQQENILVWHAVGPVHTHDPANVWRRQTAEILREDFIARLRPDILHITSLFEGYGENLVLTIDQNASKRITAVTMYDLIPLIQSEIYLKPHPKYDQFYREKLNYLKKADLYLAISESSRNEAIEYLGATSEQSVNISAASESHFKQINISQKTKVNLYSHFGLSRSFLMYSGATDERKNHLRLIKAFSLLPVVIRTRFQLVFVGGIPEQNRKKFQEYAKICGLNESDLVLTGRVTDEELVQFYNLCDLFVFPSWHEGFGLPALEAMSCGAPVIAANTSSLPEVIGRSDALFDPFNVNSIVEKVLEVLENPRLRNDLKAHGMLQAKKFTWDCSAKSAISAFEILYANKQLENDLYVSKQSNLITLAQQIERIGKLDYVSENESDRIKVASAITQNNFKTNNKQLLVDISELVRTDAKSGIQRVVRSVLTELLTQPILGFRVELVYAVLNKPGYRYARQFVSQLFGKPERIIEDELADVYSGDIFIGLDLQPQVVLQQLAFYDHLRCIGGQVYFVLYDLLPILRPKVFPFDAYSAHTEWLKALCLTDGVLCISRSVADELIDWLRVINPHRLRPFKIGWFHLGADVANSAPSRGMPSNASEVFIELGKRPTFLSVGTIEPRKGQLQTLLAFELLWSQGIDVNLVLVGKHGWNVDLLVDLLRIHSERNIRLFWLDGISDEYLEKVYAASTCLIAASEGEGFGLPLIEAAQHKKPIIARDIPVFREVAGVHACYFSGLTPETLANAVTHWLLLDKQNRAPQSADMHWLTWKQATQNLLDVVINGQWYQEWMPNTAQRFFGSDSRLGTQVGIREGTRMVSTGEAGYLLFGPYIPLSAGRYNVVIYGEVGEKGIAGASMDVASKQGSLIHGGVSMSARQDGGVLASLLITLDKKCSDLEVRVLVTAMSDLQVSVLEITPWIDEVMRDIPIINVVNETETLFIKKINEQPKIADVKLTKVMVEKFKIDKKRKKSKLKQAW